MFITFEGGEGSGKSLMSKRLAEYLNGCGVSVLRVAEPGGTNVGDRLSDILKHSKDDELNHMTELFLFNASRAQLVQEVIKPALEKNKVVICDRYIDSTMAYQGFGRGLDLEEVSIANDIASGGLMPELTIFLNIPPEEGIKRKSQCDINRFEKEDLAFHQRVYDGFKIILNDQPWRFYAIDATLPADEVFSLITEKIAEYIDLSGVD